MTDFRSYASELAALEALPDHARLDTRDAAKALALMGVPYTWKSLERLRYTSTTGPRYSKVRGFVFYELGDLRSFAGARRASAA